MKNLKTISPYKIIFTILAIITIIRLITYYQKPIKFTNYSIDSNLLLTSYKITDTTLILYLKGEEKFIAYYYLDNQNLPFDLQVGMTIHLTGEVSNISANTLPNTFNYQNYLRSQNITKQITIATLEITDQKIPPLYQLKSRILKPPTSNTNIYINALLLADNSSISEDVKTSFQLNGISHLLAISGMHITLLCQILTKFLKRLHIKRPLIPITIFLLAYLILTDFAPSIIRATIFYLILHYLKFLNLKTHQVLKISLLICLCLFPYYLTNLSFQYSATTAFFITKFPLKNKNYLSNALSISLLAFLASFPITINNFYQINLISPFLNLIFVPLISLLIYPIVLLAYLLPVIAYFLDPLIYLFEHLSLFFSHFTNLIINVPKFPSVCLIIYYFILIKSSHLNFKVYISLICLIIFVKFLPIFDYHGYIYYLNVGQGDSALIISPFQKDIIMIDTGGLNTYDGNDKPNIRLASNIQTFLKSLGINHLDQLIITHGDNDHLGTASYLKDLITIKSLSLNQGSLNASENALRRAIPIDSYKPHNLAIQFLPHQISTNENDNSTVNLITIYQQNFLFTGDISSKIEEELINTYSLPKISILKLAHHGSNTSNSSHFLSVLNPQYAIISSGLNNIYHHPAKETIENLRNLHISYYNTAYDYTIKVTISPKSFTLLPSVT